MLIDILSREMTSHYDFFLLLILNRENVNEKKIYKHISCFALRISYCFFFTKNYCRAGEGLGAKTKLLVHLPLECIQMF